MKSDKNIIIIQNCAIAYNAKRGAPERLIPSGCLQTNIFLWKPNNYPCYTVPRNVKKHEDENIWFCKYCATPKKRGYQLECPRHVGSGYDYSIENQSPKPKNPEPVLKKI